MADTSNNQIADLEKCVLSCLILDPSLIETASPYLEKSDFRDEKNSAIFAGMVSIYNSGGKVDLICLRKWLDGEGCSIVSNDYFTELINETATLALAKDYIRELGVRRQWNRPFNPDA